MCERSCNHAETGLVRDWRAVPPGMSSAGRCSLGAGCQANVTRLATGDDPPCEAGQ
jgi:hypothetical protein